MITFDGEVYDDVLEHARRGKPYEVCGVLGGERVRESRVRMAVRVENVSDTPRTNYLMEPESQLEAIDEVEDAGLDVVGFYHSHPEGPDRPSETDAARANWPDHSYVIVSLGGEEAFVGSWRWTGKEFRMEDVGVE